MRTIGGLFLPQSHRKKVAKACEIEAIGSELSVPVLEGSWLRLRVGKLLNSKLNADDVIEFPYVGIWPSADF
jgi:hypothetical protein